MKRFYKVVTVVPEADSFAIHLDGRPIRTPARNPLLLPTADLADNIVAEWAHQKEEIDPASMPLTELAQGALDQVSSERDRIVGRIAAFADSDMLYYRADHSQQQFVEHQREQWDPLLDWASGRYDVSFNLIHGIRYAPQPQPTLDRLASAVEVQDDFVVAAMLSIVGLAGSLVITLGLVERAFEADRIWPLVNLEELWQEQQWGQDIAAVDARAAKQEQFLTAARFLELCRS